MLQRVLQQLRLRVCLAALAPVGMALLAALVAMLQAAMPRPALPQDSGMLPQNGVMKLLGVPRFSRLLQILPARPARPQPAGKQHQQR